jgi:ketosteroid isomerase-like protein
VTATAARQAAETYQRAVNAKDLDLLRTIFAEDAVLAVPAALTPGDPTGTFRGIEAVMGFFAHVSFPDRATLTYTHVYEDGPTCVVELEGRLPDRTVEALDIFTVGDDGLVRRMAVYARVV